MHIYTHPRTIQCVMAQAVHTHPAGESPDDDLLLMTGDVTTRSRSRRKTGVSASLCKAVKKLSVRTGARVLWCLGVAGSIADPWGWGKGMVRKWSGDQC